jgi:hypothetical protein
MLPATPKLNYTEQASTNSNPHKFAITVRGTLILTLCTNRHFPDRSETQSKTSRFFNYKPIETTRCTRCYFYLNDRGNTPGGTVPDITTKGTQNNRTSIHILSQPTRTFCTSRNFKENNSNFFTRTSFSHIKSHWT